MNLIKSIVKLSGALVLGLSGCQAYGAWALAFTPKVDHYSIRYNSNSIAEAKKLALQSCNQHMKREGLAGKCKVADTGKERGYLAVTFGDHGAGWGTGSSSQEAVDNAYQGCVNKNIKNCQGNDIEYVLETVGLGSNLRPAAAPTGGSCRPTTSHVTCTSQCTNGSCVVTYPNGCKMRVQVQPQFNSFNNQWTYPAPSC